ncbi:LysE family translocator [Neptuniibacter sp. QD48_11]|uniref:LysE family translocator n=1 Tax=unclassified Neptuniibacter TaxID=2630693 RepID=UPI0039F4DA1D
MFALTLSMAVFALVGAITPGPVNIIATSSAAVYGFLRTLPHVLGATISYTLIVLLAGAGTHQLFQNNPQLLVILKYLGSAFLIYMAYKIATAASESNEQEQSSTPPTFMQGALSQGLNPKAWLVSISGVSVFVLNQSEPQLYLGVFGVISFAACLIGVGTWAIAGHLIKDYLAQPKQQKLFNRIMGIMLFLTIAPIWIN